MHLLLAALLLVLCADTIAAQEMPDSSVEAVRSSIQLADPDLIIEPVAVEPDVVDPVDVCWDSAGRMYVAEMRDYPNSLTGGTIRLIDDSDGDGEYDRSRVYAEGLPFPNSVLPWKDGILVCVAPEILFLRDTDGDGRADERKVILTGFAEGNQQLRINGLYWGLDGWVYAANGRSAGSVRQPGDALESAVPLGQRDLRFRPEDGSFEPIAGFSQFGICMDDWGNRFLSWNTDPIRHVVLEESVLLRNAHMASGSSVANIAESTDGGRLFPRLPPQHRFNKETVEFFNASCGTTIYRGDALAELNGDAFICEPLTSLVHRRRLDPNGSTFTARRVEQGKEFLASTNFWFRPVNLETGPDGALYVVDFCREWVEHPDFVPKELRDSVDWRVGDHLGRIWRIRPRGDFPPPAPSKDLKALSSSQLVGLLEHPNGWKRDRAQRELIEREDSSVVEAVASLATESTLPQGRIHALAVLEAWGEATDGRIIRALQDESPQVRARALSVLEERKSLSLEIIDQVSSLTSDSDPAVRLKVACIAGNLTPDQRIPIFLKLVSSEVDEWLTVAVLGGVGEDAWPILRPLLEQGDSPPIPLSLIYQLSQQLSARNDAGVMAEIREWNRNREGVSDDVGIALLAGLMGTNRTTEALFAELLTNEVFKTAVGILQDNQCSVELRTYALRIVSEFPVEDSIGILLEALGGANDPRLQAAAVRAVAESGEIELSRRAIHGWPQLAVAARKSIVTRFAASPELANLLLDGVESGLIAPVEIDPTARESLALHSSPGLAERAGLLLGQPASSDRQAVVRSYLPALVLQADAGRGAELFAQNCIACHRVQGLGNQVGPDLSGVGSRPREKLLEDILFPTSEVAPDYVNYIVVTHDEEVFTGVLAGETAQYVSIKQSSGLTEDIHRDDILEFRAGATSVMPEGFESTLDQQGLADLIEFLLRGNRAMLERTGLLLAP